MLSVIYTTGYFILIPLILFILAWKVWDSSEWIKTDQKSWPNRSKAEESRKKRMDFNKAVVLFLVCSLILLSSWGFIASEISDSAMREEIVGGEGFRPIIRDPVIDQLGPSYDTDSIINEMEARSHFWLPELVKEVVDLDELTSIPGRLAIYRLTGERYIITYTYLSPMPITQVYGFVFYRGETGELMIMEEAEETHIFPTHPNQSGDIADL